MSYNVTLNIWLQAGNVNKYDVLHRFLCAAKQEHNQRHMNYKIPGVAKHLVNFGSI